MATTPANALNISQQGYASFNASTGAFAGRTFQATTGLSVSNADGTAGNTTYSLAGGGAFAWNDVTGATQTIVAQNGYVTDRGGGVAYTLPASGTFGDMFIITGKSGLWTLAQNANQQITFGSASSTVGITGSLAATNAGDTITCVCTTAGASTVWRVVSSIGNITVN